MNERGREKQSARYSEDLAVGEFKALNRMHGSSKMNVLVALGAEGNEVRIRIITKLAPLHHVMNLEIARRSASLAAPTVPLKYATPQVPIGSSSQLDSSSDPIHQARTRSRKSAF